MAFAISGTQILVTGNETGTSLKAWGASNSAAVGVYSDLPNIVQAKYQLKIQNGATFDSSDIVLVINHRVEGQANTVTDTGIWKYNKSAVIAQGPATMFSENWAIQQCDTFMWLCFKTGGTQSFLGSDQRPTPSSHKNGYYILKTGGLDSHLQATGGTGTIENVTFIKESSGLGIMALRDTSTKDVKLKNIIPFGWSSGGGAPTTTHENMVLDSLQTAYRRNNGGALFINPKDWTGARITTHTYNGTGASVSDSAKSGLAFFYRPKIGGGWQYSVFNGVAKKAGGIMGADGLPNIVQGSANDEEKTINNTWISAGVSYNLTRYVAGQKMIVYAETPATTGGNVASVNLGTFNIVQRKFGFLPIEEQATTEHYEGTKLPVVDPQATGTEAQAAAISGLSFSLNGDITKDGPATLTTQDIINAWLYFVAQRANHHFEYGKIKLEGGVLKCANLTVNAGEISQYADQSIAATGVITGNVSAPHTDSNKVGHISAAGSSGDVVELRRASDNSVIRSRVGDGSLPVDPSEVGLSIYLARLNNGVIVASSAATPQALTAGDNGTVKLFAGEAVQVADASGIIDAVWALKSRGIKLDEVAARIAATTS